MEELTMKKMLAILMLVVCIIVSIAGISFADDMKFVTIQEWLDAKGECGDCMLLVKIQTIFNPVLSAS